MYNSTTILGGREERAWPWGEESWTILRHVPGLSKNHGYGLGGSPHPVIVSIRGNRDYIEVVPYSYTTITRWGGVLLRYGLPVVRMGILGRIHAEPYCGKYPAQHAKWGIASLFAPVEFPVGSDGF